MRKLGPIKCLDMVQDPEAPWVIFFHGFGADASDLYSLADLIPVSKPCNYLFPNGTIEVPIGPGWTGRAWWPLDLIRVQREAAAGKEWDTSVEVPPNLPELRQKAFQMIESLNVPWNRMILAGFSQGGMLAADLAMHAPSAPLGLALLSTALVNKTEMKEVAKHRAGLRFFQAHGDFDDVLTIKNASRLETLLNQAGLKGSLLHFPGGHEIPPVVIQKLGEYLNDRLGSLE